MPTILKQAAIRNTETSHEHSIKVFCDYSTTKEGEILLITLSAWQANHRQVDAPWQFGLWAGCSARHVTDCTMDGPKSPHLGVEAWMRILTHLSADEAQWWNEWIKAKKQQYNRS
jgi:hypothetical protein